MDDPKKGRSDVTKVVVGTLVTIFPGLVLAGWYAGAHWANAALWGIGCLASGALAGFLFAVPKVYQADDTSPPKAPTPSADETAKAATSPLVAGAVVSPGTPNAVPAVAVFPGRYQQRVNTNLTEISDWLTKIVVGLGLVELRSMPGRLDRLARYASAGLGGCDGCDAKGAVSLAMGILIFFPVAGFLFGYLVTRLFLQEALSRADRAAGESIEEVRREAATANLVAAKASGEVDSVRKLVALNSPMQPSTSATTIDQLVKDFDTLRANLPASAQRTVKMDALARQMIERLRGGDLINVSDALSDTTSPGRRMSGFAALIAKPAAESLPELLTSLIERESTGAGRYWGIQALSAIVAANPGVKIDPARVMGLRGLLLEFSPTSASYADLVRLIGDR